MNLKKHIWEGWLVEDFINELELPIKLSIHRITTKKELKEFCKDNQPYYKKHIPDVVNYFANKYKLK